MWLGVKRTGLNSFPRDLPANAPMGTGLYGGLKIVVPVSEIDFPEYSARTAKPSMLDVLP